MVVNDCPSIKKPGLAEQVKRHRQALSQPIPEYWCKVVKLPHGQVEVSVTPACKSTIINLRMGFNPLDCAPKPRTPEEQAIRDEANRARAARRARQNVRYLVKSIYGDHMLTFTYRDNVLDRERVASDWKEFVRLMRYRYPDWQYVAVLEQQDRGGYHIHVAVTGKQDIRWILRCWLLAIGQPPSDVSDWLSRGVKLGERSLGAVNVVGPKRRWGGNCKRWQRNKLSGYLTKYIAKEFAEADKGAKKYWHSRGVVRPVIVKFWLRAATYEQAVIEAHDLVYYMGVTDMSIWASPSVIWITGDTDRHLIGKVTSGEA